MKNRPTKRNSEEWFRVISFDELHFKNPSIAEYIKSLKTWFHKAAAAPSNSRMKNVATSTKAVRKSRSSSAIAMRSNSSNALRKYTRSRTLSVEDLKRLFLLNSVFSLDRPESSRIHSKKKSLRTKVKNGEEYLNKWDRDIKVLYSNETNKFSRSVSQNSPDPSPTDAEVPISSSSTVESSHKTGLLINACNCGSKECKSIPNRQVHDICDYRSKYCTSEKVCPYYVKRFPREDRQNKAGQGRDANEKTCTCCFPKFPTQKLVGSKNDYATKPLCTCCGSKRKETGPKIGHTVTNMSYNTDTKCYCPKHKPETHHVDTQTAKNENKARKRKKDVLVSDYVQTQTFNEICTLCYCPIPKTDYANTQTSNNKFRCRCPKTENVNTQTSKKTCPVCGPTDYSNTQTSSNMSPSYYPKRTKAVPKSYQATQTFIDFFACGCSKQKQHGSETGYGYAQTSNNLVRGSAMQKATANARLRASMTNGAEVKNRKKLKHDKEFEPPESTSLRDHNKLKTYFSKLRRRNIERQIYLNVARHRLRVAHKRSGLAPTTTTDKISSGQPTSRTRREAALSSMKLCPYCCPIFPDSPLYSTDTTSQTPYKGTKEPHKNISAQTSILKSPHVCSCLQKIVKNQDVTPDQKRKYILYHNRVRGWLVKPLRMRKSSCLGVELGLTKTQGEKPGHIASTGCAHSEVFNKPVGNHDCNCTRNRNDHRCDCPNNSNKCSCSRWFPESSFGNLRVRNPSRNNLFRNIYKKSLTRNDHSHNISTNLHACNCSPYSHEKNAHKNVLERNFSSKIPGNDCSKSAYQCFYSLYAQENNLCRNVHVKNLPRHAPAHKCSKNVHRCNGSNLRNSPSRNCLSKSDENCYKGKRNIQSYPCYSCDRQYPKVCSSVINPCCFCPIPCCITRKDKMCMTKKIHICCHPSITTRLKKAIRKCFCCCESQNSPVGCEWLFCSTPRCVCCEFFDGCKNCCKTLFLVITAVLWCPVLILLFILHDLFFPFL